MSETRITHVAAAIVIQTDTKKICVVNQNRDSWSLPKGHVDPGETHLQAAIRETYEEAGLQQLELIQELGSYQRYKIALGGGDDTSELKKITVFLFTTQETTLEPIDPMNPEARWVAANEVSQWLTHRNDQKFFTDALPGLKEFLN